MSSRSKNAAAVVAAAGAGDGQVPRRLGSIRDKTLPTSPLAAGILRQHSLATATGNLVQRTVIQSAQTVLAAGGVGGVACVGIPIGAKCKPRLTRQVAVHEEKPG